MWVYVIHLDGLAYNQSSLATVGLLGRSRKTRLEDRVRQLVAQMYLPNQQDEGDDGRWAIDCAK